MIELRPRIFIGSAREGLAQAEILRKELSSWADCDIWADPDVFELNKSTFDNLLEHLSFYDYGVMVATGDDVLASRGKSELSMRDNLLFEFGLYLGRMGKNRAFILMETGIKTFSDLLGITILQFPRGYGDAQNEALSRAAASILKHVEGREGIFEGDIFPAVPLAFGYYNNFLKVVCKRLFDTEKAKINGKEAEIRRFELRVLIPDDLSNDMKDKVARQKKINRWEQISVEAPETRAYDFFADVTVGDDGFALLQDMPTTLMSLHQAIRAFLDDSKLIGKGKKEKMIERREVRKFKQTLDFLIQQGEYTKGVVKTEIVDI